MDWEKLKEDYPENKFDSYWELTRREGVIASTERFKAYNIWARIIPNFIMYKIMQKYSDVVFKIKWWLK
jgi:hypothetical protein